MNRWVGVVGVFLVVLLLAGCAKWKNKTQTGGETSEVGAATSTAFVEAQSSEPTGLRRIWKTSVAGSPAQHLQHPGTIAVTEHEVFLGTFQGSVAALNRDTGRLLWKSGAGDRVVGGVAVDEERVFAGTRQGEMLAFSRTDGRELWRVTVSTTVASAPVVAGDKVIFITLDNRTYALNSKNGERLWVHSATPEALVVMGAGTPTVDGNRVYVGYSTGEVFAISLREGTPVWGENLSIMGGRGELDLLQDVDAGVAVPSGKAGASTGAPVVFTVNHRGRAVALYARTGAKVWEQAISAIRRPLPLYKRLFLADMDGNLVALSSDEGLGVWRTRLTEGLLTAPVVIGDKIFVANDRGRLLALDVASGRVVGMEQLGDAVLADPVLADNSLFLWTNEGNLLRYDL